MKLKKYPSVLLLEDGVFYKGWSFLDNSYSIGEIVFNTGMTGYQEIMTDPSYYDQIIAFTYPELGNTGLNKLDNESSKIHIKGIIAKNICLYPSNWRNQISLPEYLIDYSIPHIFGIDTRALTKHLRINGVMKAIISDNLNNKFEDNTVIRTTSYVNYVTTRLNYYIHSKVNDFTMYSYLNIKLQKSNHSSLKFNIVVLDFGVKYNIINRLISYGCNVYILPITSTYSLISSYKPDGILLSNGPGDPSGLHFAINTVRQLLLFANIPIFGICMGHQILSLALGANTFKLKFGHRGLNHPSGIGKYSEITSQNHGFAVNLNEVNSKNNFIKTTHFNLNDSTLAGLMYNNRPIFSVQYHPEASPGPHDSDYLFSHFISLLSSLKK
uniref:Carbamoyl phosphate synthase small chain n=1 Tax=Antithamnionella ternifolia TaxID=207919 RepID=A0A4D6WNX9_9FLOR|nr:Carbamoyl phosphate synthase small subunit [Antithamnionella ternifolia]